MKFWCRYGQDVPQQAVVSAQQVVPHVRVGQAAWHVLAEQVWGDGQTVVHEPQWAASFFKSTHTPLHAVNPAAQVGTHVPDEQVWPAGHTMPQVPQFLVSVEVLVQTAVGVPGQMVLGERHWHVDAEQTSAGTHAFPHAPQLDALVAVSTQVPVAGRLGQSATGAGLHAQAAAWQVPSPQSWPQAPQLAVSVCLFTHLRPHGSGSATVHPQTPPEQLAPAMQEVLHALQ